MAALDRPNAGSTFFSLTPGFRNHLGNNWYTLGGIQIPVTGPKSQNFGWAPTFWLLKVY